ncbi:4-carboxy-4-hydroxy-2-oxoadipate aldolase/oxaloacetate decarboxylase [Labrys wisconsinensis]|uniref:4-hydroxy-4-methyl-2-oxoglutarate aldolase n=1 Tax=Labrys wisconsinensis TaxID=425677 RepID=A0ABU0JJY5_9HYPH|nr:4-carboxy-4-hydroxy-2-oxoadipate aldolase/oxaloacetate decarboxylase [Labrys wisconsinensis]MDQ0474595.1 4-hydroxy-4-methyl-2-oxoglutarate aldolase [Labrys wisconsinensis]
MIGPEALALFRRAGAATVYEAQGRLGDVDPAIRAVVPGRPVAGPAFCIACEPGDNLALHRGVAEAAPGDVLVVAGAGQACGYLGDILAEAALCRGIAGVVVDGSVRDATELTRMGFPVWARGLAIRGAGKARPGLTGVPVEIGGVRVVPGDLVVADDDGVCVVPLAGAAAALAATERRLRQEEAVRAGLRRGELTLDLLDLRRYLPDATGPRA